MVTSKSTTKTTTAKPAVKRAIKKVAVIETPEIVEIAENKEVPMNITKSNFIRTVGRRKTAVARVRLFRDGSGKIMINGKDGKDFFSFPEYQLTAFSPLKTTSQAGKVDFSIKVSGSGPAAQSGAVRHGIARALLKYDVAFKEVLKKSGFLTRDARKKERKKPGLKRARRAPQWKKR